MIFLYSKKIICDNLCNLWKKKYLIILFLGFSCKVLKTLQEFIKIKPVRICLTRKIREPFKQKNAR
ncbi:hypothetical protein C4F50_17650 [Flavobacterium sp. KB82]|uniref:Uncharacterized protein n=1 Tax=Flavobacterium hungaricum TaxID=2082725 RepID=A0ABR9TP08_9FLAO|nr:hypothetical protein [Flavobacterium hungaricum]